MKLLILALMTFLGLSAWGAEARRQINLEWDAIENAQSYEVQIDPKIQATDGVKPTPIESGFKTITAKVKEPNWNAKLPPGQYTMKLRARDYRGVPGDWSEPSDFSVGLETVRLLSPKQNSIMKAKNPDKEELLLKWAAVPGASEYNIEIHSLSGKEIQTLQTKNTELKIELPVAAEYQWKVKAKDEKQNESEGTSVGLFQLFGPKLDKPIVEKTETAFVRKLKWSQPEHAQSYTTVISKLNPTNRKFEKVFEQKEQSQNELDVPAEWSGGHYRLSVKARAPLREGSEVATHEFDLADGNRSPAAEYNALVKKAIDRTSGWYAVASYLITQMDYTNNNYESGLKIAQKVVGGTGRLGVGWSSDRSPWGFLSIIDLSGFIFDGKNYTFASLETSGVYRRDIGERGEIRAYGGLFAKQLPALVAVSTTSFENRSLATLGPHFGAEYWHSLSPKLGLQANAHMYYNAAKISTPNDMDISPSFSTQLGFMGSYRITPNLTGLAGYTRRVDQILYKNSSYGVFSEELNNKTNVTGDYLNLYAEYDF